MRKILILAAATMVCLSGCSSVRTKMAKYDQEKFYLHSERYVDRRASVPEDLSTANFHDAYSIPKIPQQASNSVPSMLPPDLQHVKKTG